MTLPHEHLFGDLSEAVHPPVRAFPVDLADAPVTPEIAWLLREDPYASRDNARIGADQGAIVAEEVTAFAARRGPHDDRQQHGRGAPARGARRDRRGGRVCRS